MVGESWGLKGVWAWFWAWGMGGARSSGEKKDLGLIMGMLGKGGGEVLLGRAVKGRLGGGEELLVLSPPRDGKEGTGWEEEKREGLEEVKRVGGW